MYFNTIITNETNSPYAATFIGKTNMILNSNSSVTVPFEVMTACRNSAQVGALKAAIAGNKISLRYVTDMELSAQAELEAPKDGIIEELSEEAKAKDAKIDKELADIVAAEEAAAEEAAAEAAKDKEEESEVDVATAMANAASDNMLLRGAIEDTKPKVKVLFEEATGTPVEPTTINLMDVTEGKAKMPKPKSKKDVAKEINKIVELKTPNKSKSKKSRKSKKK